MIDCALKEIEEYKMLEEKQNETINKYKSMNNRNKSFGPTLRSKTNGYKNLPSTSLSQSSRVNQVKIYSNLNRTNNSKFNEKKWDNDIISSFS